MRPPATCATRCCLGPDGGRVVSGGTAPADLTLLTDRATAQALHCGRMRAQDALATGSLKVQGSPEVLAKRADVLARLDAAFTSVRTATSLPDAR